MVLSCDQILARSIVRSMEILRSRSFHVSSGKPSIKIYLNSLFAHVVNLMIAWTRVHAITTALIRSDTRQAATSPAINKIAWEHSPTRIKRRESTRLNTGVASPINYPYVSSIFQYTWRPTRAPTWPRGLPATWRAPCDSCVGHTCPATWPQCHVVTGRWTRAPRRPARHVSPAWAYSPRQPTLATSAAGNFSPFFAILTKKFLKKSNKNRRK